MFITGFVKNVLPLVRRIEFALKILKPMVCDALPIAIGIHQFDGFLQSTCFNVLEDVTTALTHIRFSEIGFKRKWASLHVF